MSDPLVDKDGNVFEQGWDGQYRQAQGWLGPKRETDWLGNAKVETDWLGNPKAETNWLGQQTTGSGGQPLYKMSGGGGGGGSGSDVGGAIAGFIVTAILMAAVFVLIALCKALFALCRSHPKIGYPLVAALIGIPLILALVSSASPTYAPPARAANPPVVQSVATSGPAAPARPTSASAPTSAPAPTATVEIPKIAMGGSTAPLVVANTGGSGVYLRKTPHQDDRLVSWQDGTVFQPTGRTATAEQREWVEVNDPKQNVGWVPTQYVSRAPTDQASHAYIVGNTDGQGVFLRRSPNLADRLKAVSDGTVLQATGKTADGDGQHWLEVREPSGAVGWVPQQYVMAR